MHRKFATVFSWFFLTSIVLVFLSVLITQHRQIDYLSKVGPTVAQSQSANEINGQVLGVQIEDLRHHYVANFLEGTKLEPYSQYIVEVSDKYSIDYRLIPAIAMKESGAGNAIDESTHNAWGFENGRTQWTTWEQAIDNVGKTLKERYIDKGMVTPEQMMAVYAPPQIHSGGKWAKDINYFFDKLQNL